MSAAGLPASFAQDRLWFLDQLEPGTAAYNLVRAFRITGPLNVNPLTSAIGAVIERHESLRTIFESVDGEARQVGLSGVDVQVPILNLADLPETQPERETLRISSAESTRPLGLNCAPFLR